MIKRNIGGMIATQRRKADLTQRELAELLDTSGKTVWSWESNRTEPNIGQVEKMAKIFECKIEDLINGGTDTFTDFEIELVEAYRNADDQVRRIVAYALALNEKRR